MKYYRLVMENLKRENNGKDPSAASIIKIVALDVEKIWTTALLPTINFNTISAKIKAYYLKSRNFSKYSQAQKKLPNVKAAIEKFLKNSDDIFDISSCKCAKFKTCSCVKSKKVPRNRQDFLRDQRSSRNLSLSHLDINQNVEEVEETKIDNLFNNLSIDISCQSYSALNNCSSDDDYVPETNVITFDYYYCYFKYKI